MTFENERKSRRNSLSNRFPIKIDNEKLKIPQNETWGRRELWLRLRHSAFSIFFFLLSALLFSPSLFLFFQLNPIFVPSTYRLMSHRVENSNILSNFNFILQNWEFSLDCYVWLLWTFFLTSISFWNRCKLWVDSIKLSNIQESWKKTEIHGEKSDEWVWNIFFSII